MSLSWQSPLKLNMVDGTLVHLVVSAKIVKGRAGCVEHLRASTAFLARIRFRAAGVHMRHGNRDEEQAAAEHRRWGHSNCLEVERGGLAEMVAGSDRQRQPKRSEKASR